MQKNNKKPSKARVGENFELTANQKFAREAMANHAKNRQKLIEKMYNKSFKAVIDDFFREIDLKNSAFYFIAEMGLEAEYQAYYRNLTSTNP